MCIQCWMVFLKHSAKGCAAQVSLTLVYESYVSQVWYSTPSDSDSVKSWTCSSKFYVHSSLSTRSNMMEEKLGQRDYPGHYQFLLVFPSFTSLAIFLSYVDFWHLFRHSSWTPSHWGPSPIPWSQLKQNNTKKLKPWTRLYPFFCVEDVFGNLLKLWTSWLKIVFLNV